MISALSATGITTKYIQKGGSHCFKCSFEKSHWVWFWPGSLQLDINKGSTGSVVCVNNITDDHAGYYGCLSDKGVLFCWLLTIKGKFSYSESYSLWHVHIYFKIVNDNEHNMGKTLSIRSNFKLH